MLVNPLFDSFIVRCRTFDLEMLMNFLCDSVDGEVCRYSGNGLVPFVLPIDLLLLLLV